MFMEWYNNVHKQSVINIYSFSTLWRINMIFYNIQIKKITHKWCPSTLMINHILGTPYIMCGSSRGRKGDPRRLVFAKYIPLWFMQTHLYFIFVQYVMKTQNLSKFQPPSNPGKSLQILSSPPTSPNKYIDRLHLIGTNI